MRIKNYKIIGLTKNSQLAILKHEGYQESDFPELRIEPGFYKGFPILDPNLETTLRPPSSPLPPNTLSFAQDDFIVKPIDSTQPVRYTKKNIDIFRGAANQFNDPAKSAFGKTKQINGVEVFANRTPQEC